MKRLISIFLLLPVFVFAQRQKAGDPEPFFSVYLVGDAGEDTTTGPALKLLQSQLEKNPNSAVVFLGDNAYPHGLETNASNKKTTVSEKKLRSQLTILQNYPGQAYFVPGNHDWKNGKWNGLENVKQEANFVEDYLRKNSTVENKETGVFFPNNGLPGPSSVLIFKGKEKMFQPVRLVMIDTQWWLHSEFFHAVGKVTGMSRKQTEEKFFHDLDSTLLYSKNHGEKVILASHHMMYSNGNHSHDLQPLRFLMNIGLLQPLGLLGGNRFLGQNMYQPRYKKMRKKLLAVIDKYDNLIYACGHDHNIQYFHFGTKRFIVSGSGSKLTTIKKKHFVPVFSEDQQTGFVRVAFYYEDHLLVEAWGAKKEGVIFRELEK